MRPGGQRRVVTLLVALLIATGGAIGVAFLLAGRSGPATPAQLSDQAVTRHFLTIAFGREHARRPARHLAKWHGPIRYAIARWTGGPDAQKAEIALHRQMRQLATLTGLTITKTTLFKANFLIALTTEQLFAWQVKRALASANKSLGSEVANANCAGFFGQDPKTRAIISARVIIPVDRAARRGLLDRCIVEETAQVLGLPNDADGGVRSVFNDADTSARLSPLDRLFVALLYHSALTAGMTPPETRRVIRQILPALRRRMRY